MKASQGVGTSRVSLRKRLMLEVIANDAAAGVILHNELRCKVFALERQRGSPITPENFIRSFKRTIGKFGAPMRHFTLQAEQGLTAGIAARHGIWELIERGYLSSLPAAEECSVVVGLSSFSILGTLVSGTRSLLYKSDTVGIQLVSADPHIRLEGLRQVSTVPWALYEVTAERRLSPISPNKPVRELRLVPNAAIWADGKEQRLERSDWEWMGGSSMCGP